MYVLCLWCMTFFFTFYGSDFQALLCLHEDPFCILFCSKARIHGTFNSRQCMPWGADSATMHAPVCLWHGLNHEFVVKEVKQDNARNPQDVQINELISLNLIFSSQVYILCKGNPQFSLLSSMPFLPKSLDRLDLSDCSEGCSGLRSRLEVDTSLAIKKESPC